MSQAIPAPPAVSRAPGRALAAVGLASFLALGVLVAMVARHRGMHLNTALLLDIHAHYGTAGGHVAAIVSRLAEPAVALGLALLLAAGAWMMKARRIAVTLAGVALGAAAVTLILKHVFHEARPHLFVGLTVEKGYSFPSGHALVATALCPVYARILADRFRAALSRIVTWAAFIAAPLAIGFDRLYLGVHWPTDVLAGFLAGLCLACGGLASLKGAPAAER